MLNPQGAVEQAMMKAQLAGVFCQSLSGSLIVAIAAPELVLPTIRDDIVRARSAVRDADEAFTALLDIMDAG